MKSKRKKKVNVDASDMGKPLPGLNSRAHPKKLPKGWKYEKIEKTFESLDRHLGLGESKEGSCNVESAFLPINFPRKKKRVGKTKKVGGRRSCR